MLIGKRPDTIHDTFASLRKVWGPVCQQLHVSIVLIISCSNNHCHSVQVFMMNVFM